MSLFIILFSLFLYMLKIVHNHSIFNPKPSLARTEPFCSHFLFLYEAAEMPFSGYSPDFQFSFGTYLIFLIMFYTENCYILAEYFKNFAQNIFSDYLICLMFANKKEFI